MLGPFVVGARSNDFGNDVQRISATEQKTDLARALLPGTSDDTEFAFPKRQRMRGVFVFAGQRGGNDVGRDAPPVELLSEASPPIPCLSCLHQRFGEATIAEQTSFLQAIKRLRQVGLCLAWTQAAR